MTSLKIASYSAPCVVLGKDRQWWVFLLSSIVTPFLLTVLVIIARALIWVGAKARNKIPQMSNAALYGLKVEIEVPWISALMNAADVFVSIRFRMGQIMMTLAFILSMSSLFIYYNSVSFFIPDVEHCQPWVNNVSQQVDFAFNCFFLIYFMMRFIASDDKISMLFNIYSIIDYFTVPPAFVGIALDRDWIGLKFLRVLYLRRVSTIFASYGIMTSTPKIKLLQLGMTWIAVLLAAGGVFHLLENSGDPFYGDFDGQRVTYWDFCYFAFGTMATLGSADVNVKTVLGKLCNCFLVLITLAVIAVALPDVSDLLEKRRKYDGEHRKAHNERHVVICGDVSYESIITFFNEFFHPDRGITNMKLVVLGAPEPDIEYGAWLKKRMYQITYLQGSLLNVRDLYRSKVHEADACIILADKSVSNADAEDSNNIMRVVAMKNYHPTVRVIVQLLQYRSKAYLTSIPSWNPTIGDDVICLPELKLGLIAQSCIAPGFSTLMANLFAARSSDTRDYYPEWMNEYLEGAGKEMYCVQLSDYFDGWTFTEVVQLCYTKLNVLLFAVSTEPITSESSFFTQSFVVNPLSSYQIRTGMSGCFIADSAKDVEAVSIYCKLCHEDIADASDIRPCSCAKKLDVDEDEEMENKEQRRRKTRLLRRKMSMDLKKAKEDRSRPTEAFQMKLPTVSNLIDSAVVAVANTVETVANHIGHPIAGTPTESQQKLDLETTSMGEVSLLDRENEDEDSDRYQITSFEMKIMYFMRNFGCITNWNKHGEMFCDDEGRKIVLTDAPRYDSTGMFWWCPPKSYHDVLMDRFQASKMKFRHHVVLVIFSNENSAPVGLNNFVMPLRSSTNSYDELRDVVIIGDPRFLSLEWQFLSTFPKVYLVRSMGLSRADLRAVDIHMADMVFFMTCPSGLDHQSSLLADKDPILSYLTIKAMSFGVSESEFLDDSSDGKGPSKEYRTGLTIRQTVQHHIDEFGKKALPKNASSNEVHIKHSVVRGYDVPIIVDLINDSNVQFVEQDDLDVAEFFMAEPFLCGNAFATSVLQSLLVATFFNPFTLGILRLLIFGGITPEFDQILSEGAGLIGGPNISQRHAFTDRCILNQISVQDVRFVRHVHDKYGHLFLDALLHHNIILMGIYRLIAPGSKGARGLRRYVITNPPRDMEVRPDDMLFIIERAKPKYSW